MSWSPAGMGGSGNGSYSDRSDRMLPALRGAPEAKMQMDDSPYRRHTEGGMGGSSLSATFASMSMNAAEPAPAMDDPDGLSPRMEANPFSLPRDDVFALRQREKEQKAMEKERLQKMKIWEKPSRAGMAAGLSSTQPITGSGSYAERQAERSRYLQTSMNAAGGQASRAGPSGASSTFGRSEGGSSMLGGGNRLFQGRRREKENMSDFIAKKRDMFLIQMSLDTKKAEIAKLEEKAAMKEEALKKSELMLEEDAMRFDAFLKENDRKAHDALKRADMETKEKQEKVLEIKKLNAEISKIENEMSKYEEQLLACMKYKEFLDSLTPQEHWDKIARRRAEKKKAKLAAAKKQEEEKAAAGVVDGSQSHTLRVGSASSSPSTSGLWDTSLPLGALDDDESDDESAASSMYFERPEQLLEIFAQLEERNLFLIQNVQETEEALDELQNKYDETKREMEEKNALLHASITDLKTKIKNENEKAEALRKRARANTIAGSQQKLLAGLSEKVKEVYQACGMDPDTQTDTLDMLRDIEQWLEQLLSEISVMDPAKVEAAEKKKNNERRDQIRKLKKEEQKRQYEERLAKSTARAKAEVVKQEGKQVMFRSPPLRKKKKKEDVEVIDEEAEELKRFFT